jgi:O-antigen ligase
MKYFTRYWAVFAGPFVTLALGFGFTFDNINVIKLLVLGLFGGLALTEITYMAARNSKFLFTRTFVFALVFLLGLTVPLIFSGSPVAQQLFGTSGRQLGFLHYFFLLLVLLGVSTLSATEFWPKILSSLVVVGLFEAGYGLMQFFGIDPFPWKNPNNWIFGTFGNPNYLSSFLAWSTLATFYKVQNERRNVVKLFYVFASFFQGIVILLSGSSQGLFLLAFGLTAFVLFSAFKHSRYLGWSSLSLSSLLGVMAILGIFQIGPLSRFLYQDSITYRGDYWRAGLRMFKANWIHGVGLDSYGDYYRMYRDVAAANRRGLDSFSNSAHNLFIDLAACGGLVLLIGYLSFLGLVCFVLVKKFRGSTAIPKDYKLLVTLWGAFNLQTLISVNVPGLAIWGSVFSGLILSYDKEGATYLGPGRRIGNGFPKDTSLLATIFVFGCLLLVMPLVNRDTKLAYAFKTNNIPAISKAISLFPRDADQMAGVALAYETLGRNKDSLKLAKKAVLENRNCTRAWKIIFESSLATDPEKKRAEKNIRRLDPFFVKKFG